MNTPIKHKRSPPTTHQTERRRTAQGQRLLSRRRQLQLTQKQVAQRADMPESQYAHYEQGLQDPTTPVLIRLSEALECSSDYIIGLSEKN